MRLFLSANLFLLQTWATALEPAPASPAPCQREKFLGDCVSHDTPPILERRQSWSTDELRHKIPTITAAPISALPHNLERDEHENIDVRQLGRPRKGPRPPVRGGGKGWANGKGQRTRQKELKKPSDDDPDEDPPDEDPPDDDPDDDGDDEDDIKPPAVPNQHLRFNFGNRAYHDAERVISFRLLDCFGDINITNLSFDSNAHHGFVEPSTIKPTVVSQPGSTISMATTTTPTPTPSPSGSAVPAPKGDGMNKAGIAAGSVFGGFVVIAVAFLALLYHKRWRNHKQQKEDERANRKSQYLAISVSDNGDSQSETPEIEPDYQGAAQHSRGFAWDPDMSYTPVPPYSSPEIQGNFQPHTPVMAHTTNTRFYPSMATNDDANLPFNASATTRNNALPESLRTQQPVSMTQPTTSDIYSASRSHSIGRKPLPSTGILPAALPPVSEFSSNNPPTPPSTETPPSGPSSATRSTYGARRVSRSSVSSLNQYSNHRASQYSPVSSLSPVDSTLAGQSYDIMQTDYRLPSQYSSSQPQQVPRPEAHGVHLYPGT
ncbi:predicted protein [Uncinocarpus reesii 1704]|uniref:Mid2 domain-containing protein n=1 Tax=Uncinocarpus reesii (strain UAMH 1704) TaxID=336963 RepID=C4JQX2_UNCRE|nr:uncharacterized protein UREG_03454 [Uncinocarpus reesii 1704]EEP78608.1 predicted protein [Uncinocarpus reesii 1704]